MSQASDTPESTGTPRAARLRSRWRPLLLVSGLVTLCAAGLLSAQRVLAFGPFHHRPRAESAEELRQHMQRPVDFVLKRLDATEEQRARIDAILDARAPELFALHGDGRALREELVEALSAPQIDRERILAARSDLDALASRAAGLSLEALVEVAEALTPEQRAEVADTLARMHEQGPSRHRGHRAK